MDWDSEDLEHLGQSSDVRAAPEGDGRNRVLSEERTNAFHERDGRLDAPRDRGRERVVYQSEADFPGAGIDSEHRPGHWGGAFWSVMTTGTPNRCG